MPTAGRRRVRNLILNIHLYLSLGLAILLVPIALTGAPLVWRDDVDRALNPDRYAVSGASVDRLPSAYAASALAAAGADQRVADIRLPDQPGWPVRVSTRAPAADGRAARSLVVYLDPPTGRALGVAGVSDTFVGVLHNFHHMLSAPQISGRQIVGWVGVGMLILSLSGIYLWWPRNDDVMRALRWRRSSMTTANLHHLFGFWISIPLAVVSLTGIYLSFPRTAHALMSSVAAVSGPAGHGGYGAMPLQKTGIDPDGALERALDMAPGARLVALAAPVASKAEHAGEGGEPPAWRVELLRPGNDAPTTVVIDDRTGAAHAMPAPPAGDRAARWIGWIHEGRRGGPLWAVLVFLTGALPPVFLVTGVVMWLRRRSARKAFRAPAAVAEADPVPAR